MSVPPESETAPPEVEIVDAAAVTMPPPREVVASVSDHRVTAPPAVVMLLFARMSTADLTSKLPEPVMVWFAFKVTEPAVDSKLADPFVFQAFGKVNDLAVVIEIEPPAERVPKFVK